MTNLTIYMNQIQQAVISGTEIPLPANIPGLIPMIPDSVLKAKTGKTKSDKITWEDVYKVMGFSAQLWALIAPFIPRKSNNTPAVPVPPQPTSSDVSNVVLWVGIGLAAILILKK